MVYSERKAAVVHAELGAADIMQKKRLDWLEKTATLISSTQALCCISFSSILRCRAMPTAGSN